MFFNIFLELGLFLVLLLAVLLVLLFLRAKEKKSISPEVKQEPIVDLESIIKTIKFDIQSTQELEENLKLVLENYEYIENFVVYEELFIAVTLSKYTTKNIILSFEKELSTRNPKYKKRISDTIVDALKLR